VDKDSILFRCFYDWGEGPETTLLFSAENLYFTADEPNLLRNPETVEDSIRRNSEESGFLVIELSDYRNPAKTLLTGLVAWSNLLLKKSKLSSSLRQYLFWEVPENTYSINSRVPGI
jgi:hypothetical protein